MPTKTQTPWLVMALSLFAWSVSFAAAGAAQETAAEPPSLSRTPCTRPASLHCPDKDCTGDRVINPGPEVEMKSRRTYFLDYPCDWKPGDDVTLVLSLHGGGSYANWQRHYFPILDYVDQYRLVVATPSSPTQVWSDADDQYLHDIVDSVLERVGRENVKAFWLAGHSQGGLTSRRIVCTDYFADKVDGFLSLSGGRLGGSPGRVDFGFRPPRPAGGTTAAGGGGNPFQVATPTCDFSFVFTTGQLEMDEKGLPEASEWAAKYHCGPQSEPREIADDKAGYVFDTRRQNPPNPAWGRLPRPGTAQATTYPSCDGGKVVADVVRIDKGHTEGLEPHVTEELVKLMLSAPGGKLQSKVQSGG